MDTLNCFFRPEEPLRAYWWSSFVEYLQPAARRPAWLRVDRLLGESGIPKDSVAGREQFEQLTEERRRGDDPGEWKALRRGWCLGEEQFRGELIEQMAERMGMNQRGREDGKRRSSVNAIFHLPRPNSRPSSSAN